LKFDFQVEGKRMTCEETDEGIVSDQSYEYEDVVVSTTSTDNKMRTKVR
jgi:hypothetical protein